MDREAKDPFDLLEELERELGIETYAMNWPIGSGKEFQGSTTARAASCSSSPLAPPGRTGRASKEIDLYDPHVATLLGEGKHRQLMDEVELLGAGRDFDLEEVGRDPQPRVLWLRPHQFRRGAFPGGVSPDDPRPPPPGLQTAGWWMPSPRTFPPLYLRFRRI